MAKWDLSKLPEGRKPLPDEWFAERAHMQEHIEELEAKLEKAIGHIKWFISEDETNRGDEPMPSHGNRTWNEINAYWLKHLDDAIAFVAELTGGKDE